VKIKFLLDTNFLMVPGQFRVDVFEQLRRLAMCDFFVVDLSIDELDKLAKKGGKDAGAAKVGRILVRREGVRVIPSGKAGNADEAIRRVAKREGMVVCTQDAELKAALRRRGVRIATLRQKKYVELE
jgi:rRNA-processing protein FCF1